jgi:hypothetical protein
MWYLVDRKTGRKLCYSKSKRELESYIKDATYPHWVIEWYGVDYVKKSGH